jgi:heme-degrading monooxygenase HmoA
MPALPWTTISELPPDDEVVVVASCLSLLRHRHLPWFLRQTLRVRRQLGWTEGLIGFSMDADLVHKTFWTVSAWDSRQAVTRFERADPHNRVADHARARIRPGTFVFWNCRFGELPLRWSEVRDRVAAGA